VPIQGQTHRKCWRLFQTPLGNPIIKSELAEVAKKSLVDYSNIRAAMKEVEREGIRGTKQIEDEIRQIEAEGEYGVTYRRDRVVR